MFFHFFILYSFWLYFTGGAPLRGALGRAPPPVCRAEILKKFSGKSVLETILYFLGKNILKRSKTYLKRQISSRGSGCNFSCPKLIGERQSYDIFFSTDGKMTFLRFIRDVNNPIGSLFQFFGSIRPFPKKKLVLSLFSKNLQKRHFFRNFCFPLTGFFAWEFS